MLDKILKGFIEIIDYIIKFGKSKEHFKIFLKKVEIQKNYF